MKNLLLAFFASITLCPSAWAQSAGPLPFSVSLGGTAATAKDGEPFAKIAQPVAADAAIEVGAKSDMIIINVSKLGPDGTPNSGTQPAIILLQNSQTGSLAKTMDQQKLAPGPYLMSITADGQTALIRCTIQ